ncbi:MAG: sigma-54 dependent transcriptional regulator [Thermodesulfobacteriota bacterium]
MKIVIVDDERSIRRSLEMFLAKKGYGVLTAENGESGLLIIDREQPDIVILDIRLPGMSGLEVLRSVRGRHPTISVIMMTAFHDMDTTIEAMKLGAYEYIHKPIDIDELEIAIEKVARNIKLSGRLDDLITEISRDYKVHNIVGTTPAMQEIFKLIGLVSENRATVLIQGESGTGKELIAKTIHYNSAYAKEPFVPVNCSVLVESLFASELFGHEKGAFTGAAYQKRGKIELAQNGTIFFDEIGDISPTVQVKLLRFLQEREFERVGGEERLRSCARIIAATNRNLSKLVLDKSFREDLYFRLKVVEINVPPLRSRKSDIPLLVDHLLNKINLDLHKNVTKIPWDTMDRLMSYDWPGNVRELENVLTRAVVLSKGDILSLDSFADLLPYDCPCAPPSAVKTLDEVVRDHVLATLRNTNWHRGKACELLGISRPTLRDMIKKYNLLW